MTLAPYMHVGLLVADLETAIGNFSDVLKLEFTKPTVAHVDDFVEIGSSGSETRRAVDIRVAYSTQGPPYYELIEAHEGGLYGRGHGLGLHHLGMWEPDCERRLTELESAGVTPEAIQYTPDQRIIVAYFRPAGLEGMRFEILDEGRRPMMEEWIAGGDFADYV